MARARIVIAIVVVLAWPSVQTAHMAFPAMPVTKTTLSSMFVNKMAENIRAQLDDHVVGYAFFLGPPPTYGTYGYARTAADKSAVAFTKDTKMTVASVSKIVTAIAAVRILARYRISLDAPIGSYLPSDWSASASVRNTTFAQLLSHTAGIQDYGSNSVLHAYEILQKFFGQPVSIVARICQGPGVHLTQNGITMNTRRCYSNYNLAIFRILLPKVAGRVEDKNPEMRPRTLAEEYVELVQQNVFDRVGQKDVLCRPPAQGPGASTYALAYNFPGTSPGQDWGDQTLTCGAAGWYLSVEDIARVFLSLAAGDGRLLTTEQFEAMRTRHLGWDDRDDDSELEKDGGRSETAGTLTTSVAIFEPVRGVRFVGILFLNSDVWDGPSCGTNKASGVLENAYSAMVPIPPGYPQPKYPRTVSTDWPGLGEAFPAGIRAGVVWPDGNVYFFKGDRYVKYNIDSKKADKAKPIVKDWPGLGEAFPRGIDAGVVWPNGRAYFFRGNRYVEYDMDPEHPGVVKPPAPILKNWPGLGEAFPRGIDTGVVWPNRYAYFFKGDLYVRYNMQPGAERVERGYPKPVKGNWPGLFETLPKGFDAAVVWECKIADFFNGNQSVRYRISPVVQP